MPRILLLYILLPSFLQAGNNIPKEKTFSESEKKEYIEEYKANLRFNESWAKLTQQDQDELRPEVRKTLKGMKRSTKNKAKKSAIIDLLKGKPSRFPLN